jgi:hypothetical protein
MLIGAVLQHRKPLSDHGSLTVHLTPHAAKRPDDP